MKDWIQTYTGKKFYPLNPDINDLDIRDQARALSMCCRYAGHVKRFYSVAEHAVRISMELQDRGYDTITQKWGLVHDNTEAYLGDVTRPLKTTPIMLGYRNAEANLQFLISEWLELPSREPQVVKDIDTEILGTEVHALKQPIHPDWAATTSTGKLDDPWKGWAGEDLGWDPTKAEANYLSRFKYLWGPHAFGL